MASLRLRAFPDRGFLVWFALTAGIIAWIVHLVAFAALVENSSTTTATSGSSTSATGARCW